MYRNGGAVRSLENFMKEMARNTNLPGKRTSRSARRTMISIPRHEDVHPLDITQLLGHKNLSMSTSS